MMKPICVMGLLVAGIGSCRAEVICFRTPAMAAVQVGQQEGGGYRLEFVRRDALGGRSWAAVRSCAHPEWPAVLVGVLESVRPHLKDERAVSEPGHPNALAGVVAGRVVRVLQSETLLRIEMTGVAQASAAVGEQVLVRLPAVSDGTEERVAKALVTAVDVVEIGR